MSWDQVQLGELTRIRTGKLDANASSEDGEYPFFTCARKPLKIDSYSYDCECVLVAGNGDLNVKHYSGKFDAYQRTYIVEAIDKENPKLHIRYAYHFLETYLERLREQSIGGIIKYIKLGNLTEARIPLPPLEEQKRIAKILDAADALRAKRRESLAQLDALLQSTFLDLFGDPTEADEKRDCPVVLLSDLAERVTDGTHQSPTWSEGGVPFLFVSNIRHLEVDFSTKKFVSEEEYERLTKRCPIEPGDVLYTTVGSYGHSAVVPEGHRFAFQRHIAHVKPKRGLVNPEFLSVMLESPGVKKQADRLARGVAQKTLNLKELKSFRVFQPTKDRQDHFAEITAAIVRQKEQCKSALEELNLLFFSLQAKAFSGEL